MAQEGGRFGTGLVDDLVRVAEVLASPGEVDVKLSRLCSMAVRMIGCDRSSIFLADDGCFRARSNHGNPPDIASVFPSHRVRLDDPLVARAIETRSFVVANER